MRFGNRAESHHLQALGEDEPPRILWQALLGYASLQIGSLLHSPAEPESVLVETLIDLNAKDLLSILFHLSFAENTLNKKAASAVDLCVSISV